MTNLVEPGKGVERDQYGSAAEYAYDALKAEIVGGRFSPGRRMREIELSSWLGVSRTPTRQALSRLELEGLLSLKPRFGLVVASLDGPAMEELYEMRGALEGAAAALAARHASARDLDLLAELVRVETQLPADPDVRYRHNITFHGAIYDAAHNRFLMKSLHALNDSIALLGPTTMAASGRLAVAAAEHAAIVACIAARDAQGAEHLARAHVLEALELRRAMRQAMP